MKRKLASAIFMVILLLAVSAGCTAKVSKEIVFYVDGTEYSKVVYDSNGEFKKPEDPEKRGYRFSGWYLDESFSKALKLNKKTKGKIKAYARFDEIRAELFQNGVSIGTHFILDVEAAKPKNGNLTFDGWYIDEEYKKRYNGEIVDKLYGRQMARVTITNGFENLMDVLINPGDKIEEPELNSQFLKSYMDEKSVFEFKSKNEKFDFSKEIKENTLINILWGSKGITYTKNQNSDTYTAEIKNSSLGDTPVISIPARAMVNVGGNYEEKEIVSVVAKEAFMGEIRKVIIADGIKYIKGLNGNSFDASNFLEEIVMPKTIKIIEDSFSNINNLDKCVIPEGVEVIANSFWKSLAIKSPNAVPYKGTIKIPKSVKYLFLMPSNLEFEEGSKFYKENGRIYTNEGDKKILVALETEIPKVVEIKEGVTHIQPGIFERGAFDEMCKQIKIPSSWNNRSDEFYIDAYDGYQNPNGYFATTNDAQTLEEKLKNRDTVRSAQLQTVVRNLKDLEMVEFNLKSYPIDADKHLFANIELAQGGNPTVHSLVDLGDKVLFSQEIETGESATIKLFAKNIYTNLETKVTINKNSGEEITENEIQVALGLSGTDKIESVEDHTGVAYNYHNKIKRNMLLKVKVGTSKLGFNYEIVDNEVEVVSFDISTANETINGTYEIFVPSEISGKKVTKIRTRAFESCNEIEKVYIAENLEEIGDMAFKNCENLKEVIIRSKNFRKIGKRSFEDSGLEKIKLPLKKLQEVGEYAFRCKEFSEFLAVEEEYDTVQAINGLPLSFPSIPMEIVENELIKDRFYFAPVGSKPSGVPCKFRSSQLIRYRGETKVKVKKNTTSDDFNEVTVLDFDLYAVAAKGAYGEYHQSSTDNKVILQLGFTARNRFANYGVSKDAPVVRYTIKTGAINYIPSKTNLRTTPDVEVIIEFAVIKKVEKGAFNDMNPEFLTELDYEGKLSKIGVYKGNEEEETCETDEWVTKADFLNKQIFEEGWWENIMSDSAEYEKIKMIANKINTYSDISYM